MIRFAADEDFNNDVVRALRRALPEVNMLGVREAGRGGQPDPEVLAWGAAEARVLLTHDVTTMIRHALDRVARGEPMPGVIALQVGGRALHGHDRAALRELARAGAQVALVPAEH